MTITEARTYYRGIMSVLRTERSMRQRVLSEPRRSAALAEIDAALTALTALGQIIAAAQSAGLLESIPEQAPLFDLPDRHNYEDL